MMTAASKPYLLPPEHLASIVSSIELLSAMWSGTDELTITPHDDQTIRTVAQYLQLPLHQLASEEAQSLKAAIRDEVALGLLVRPNPDHVEMAVSVRVALRLRGKHGVRMWVSAKDAPVWMDRGSVDTINGLLSKSLDEESEGGEEDMVGQVLSAVEQLSEHLITLTPVTATQQSAPAPACAPSPQPDTCTAETIRYVRRTWYYLPSLSTPSKRKDICHLALTSEPPLTGFLLAGKPGLIVIEYPLPLPASASACTSAQGVGVTAEQSRRASLAMDRFWSTIKTTSWCDMPASHKKISQKLTQESTPQAFTTFQDVTDDPDVERGAERGRKTDVSKLIRWLDAKGIQGKWAMERCLGVGSWHA